MVDKSMKTKFTLSANEQSQIESLRAQSQPGSNQWLLASILLMRNAGVTLNKISEELQVPYNTVRNVERRFNQIGLYQTFTTIVIRSGMQVNPDVSSEILQPENLPSELVPAKAVITPTFTPEAAEATTTTESTESMMGAEATESVPAFASTAIPSLTTSITESTTKPHTRQTSQQVLPSTQPSLQTSRQAPTQQDLGYTTHFATPDNEIGRELLSESADRQGITRVSNKIGHGGGNRGTTDSMQSTASALSAVSGSALTQDSALDADKATSQAPSLATAATPSSFSKQGSRVLCATFDSITPPILTPEPSQAAQASVQVQGQGQAPAQGEDACKSESLWAGEAPVQQIKPKTGMADMADKKADNAPTGAKVPKDLQAQTYQKSANLSDTNAYAEIENKVDDEFPSVTDPAAVQAVWHEARNALNMSNLLDEAMIVDSPLNVESGIVLDATSAHDAVHDGNNVHEAQAILEPESFLQERQHTQSKSRTQRQPKLNAHPEQHELNELSAPVYTSESEHDLVYRSADYAAKSTDDAYGVVDGTAAQDADNSALSSDLFSASSSDLASPEESVNGAKVSHSGGISSFFKHIFRSKHENAENDSAVAASKAQTRQATKAAAIKTDKAATFNPNAALYKSQVKTNDIPADSWMDGSSDFNPDEQEYYAVEDEPSSAPMSPLFGATRASSMLQKGKRLGQQALRGLDLAMSPGLSTPQFSSPQMQSPSLIEPQMPSLSMPKLSQPSSNSYSQDEYADEYSNEYADEYADEYATDSTDEYAHEFTNEYLGEPDAISESAIESASASTESKSQATSDVESMSDAYEANEYQAAQAYQDGSAQDEYAGEYPDATVFPEDALFANEGTDADAYAAYRGHEEDEFGSFDFGYLFNTRPGFGGKHHRFIINLSPQEKDYLQHIVNDESEQQSNSARWMKSCILLLSNQGETVANIAEKLNLSKTYVSRIRSKFISLGLDELLMDRNTMFSELYREHVKQLIKSLIEHSPKEYGYNSALWTSNTLQDYLWQNCESLGMPDLLDMQSDDIYRILRRLVQENPNNQFYIRTREPKSRTNPGTSTATRRRNSKDIEFSFD